MLYSGSSGFGNFKRLIENGKEEVTGRVYFLLGKFFSL
jgi:hypothetical protein